MPHLTIEFSANVGNQHDIDALVAVVHQAALDHGLAAVDGLRTRAVERRCYRVGDGGPDLGFIAITARIGPGRDESTKTTFLEHILDQAQANINTAKHGASSTADLAIAWSIEIQEIDAAFRINRNEVSDRLGRRPVADTL